jgi:hypothetical protein
LHQPAQPLSGPRQMLREGAEHQIGRSPLE